jgi:hypothetical protein
VCPVLLLAVELPLNDIQCDHIVPASLRFRLAEVKAEYEASLIRAYVPSGYVKQEAINRSTTSNSGSDADDDD